MSGKIGYSPGRKKYAGIAGNVAMCTSAKLRRKCVRRVYIPKLILSYFRIIINPSRKEQGNLCRCKTDTGFVFTERRLLIGPVYPIVSDDIVISDIFRYL